MNRERRKQLATAGRLVEQARAAMHEAKALIQTTLDEEREALESMSEGARNGMAGEVAEAAISAMEQALEGVDSGIIENVADAIRAAQEGGDVPQETLTDQERDARRRAMLPKWVVEEIERAKARAEHAEAEMRDMFGEPSGNPSEILGDDYGKPTEGRVLPVRRVRFAAHGITVSATRQGVEIRGDRSIIVRPNVANSIVVALDQ